mgnify:CR=1 FL=1
MDSKFKIKRYPELGELTTNDVVYYDVYSCGYNIPATPTPDGLTALAEKGDTFNLTGMSLFIEWDLVHDVRRFPSKEKAK